MLEVSTQRDSASVGRRVTEALDGRLPVLPGLRPYSGFLSFLWTCAALACASYAYLVGGALATLGNTWVAILGYWAGTLIGMVLVTLAVGVPAFRYGVDTVDAAKSALGVRGAFVMMMAVVLSSVGWGNVLIAMTARSAGTLIALLQGTTLPVDAASEKTIATIALVTVALLWWLASHGPEMVGRLTHWCVPGQLLIAAVVLVLLLLRHSPAGLLHAQSASLPPLVSDPHLRVTLAIEFGLNNGFTMTPFLGGLTRLVATRRILVTPAVLGYSCGAAFISGVAALATATSGSSDPLSALLIVAGPVLGAVIVAFLIIANLGAMVALFYLGGISVQQLGPLARLPWKVSIALLLLPSLVVAFQTRAVLIQVMQLLTYNGVMFVGVVGVLLADFYLLRRQVLLPAHLFTHCRAGQYWYRGGLNWIALTVIALATTAYFKMFNPVTLAVAPPFRVAGAAIPLVLASGILYYGGSRLFGRYCATPDRSGAIRVGL